MSKSGSHGPGVFLFGFRKTPNHTPRWVLLSRQFHWKQGSRLPHAPSWAPHHRQPAKRDEGPSSFSGALTREPKWMSLASPWSSTGLEYGRGSSTIKLQRAMCCAKLIWKLAKSIMKTTIWGCMGHFVSSNWLKLAHAQNCNLPA